MQQPKRTTAGMLFGVSAVFLVTAIPALAHDKPIILKVKRIYPVSSTPIDGGMLLIRDGKISTLGADIVIPDGARVIELLDGVVTPGLIDAHAAVDPEMQQSTEGPDRSFWRAFENRAALVSATAIPEGPNLRDAQDDTPLELRDLRDHDEHGHGDEQHAHGGRDGTCPLCGKPDLAPLAVSNPMQRTFSEQSAEVVPHRLAIDTYNPFSNDFERLLRSGVTTVYLSPDSACVIGMRGAIVKTGGDLARRVVRRADAVKVTLGGDPSRRGGDNELPPGSDSFQMRRPTTRMGVEWVFRKALFDARRAAAGLPVRGSDAPPTAAIPALNELLAGKIGLRMQARMQHDIFTALRLADEFGLRFVLEEATEAYQALPQLKAAGVPVIFGPVFITPRGYRAVTGEANDPRLITPKALLDAGIPFALTANDLRDEDGLVRQAMIAVRYGLPEDAALRAITAAPAEIMGLGESFGTLAAGGSADLVVWSAEPFDPASRPLLVMIDGVVVHEE